MKPLFQREKQSGMALVIVLCFLIIISGLIVAFFGSVTTELAATKSYSAGVTAKQLSDMATNLVMAQIRDATRGYQTPGVPTSAVLSWASQPGMIRTYDDSGSPYAYYKLYSSGNMLLRNLPPQYNVNDEFDRDVPKAWESQTGIYTDLNAPVVVPDPNGSITLNGGNYRLDYPILDPSAAIAPGVEGLTVGTIGDPVTPAPAINPKVVPKPNPAALPCRWLYVLKDGSTISPSSSTNGKVTFENSEIKPSAANPIVGRMAFWTDDETTKVNVNTAGEGTFWDIPRSNNAAETAFSTSMPAQNEFQRLPGHPAMTCLSTVLENLDSYWSLKGSSYATAVHHYLDFAPRLEFGGSQAGSAKVDGNTAPIVADHDRLFASLDELAFDVRYKGTGGPLPTRTRELNLAKTDIEKLRFFLTTSSRAPETNLFNLPRICLWPIQKDSAYQSAKEKLIAFCTSTGTSTSGGTANYYPYYFQRLSIYSGDGRLNLTNPPPSSQSGWEDFALSSSGPVGPNSTASRNAVLYKYLQNLTSRNFPGFGGSFVYKYDTSVGLPKGYSDRDQILTEMYDMNRSGLNSYTSNGNLTYFYAGTHSMTQYSAGESQVVPAVITPSGKMNTPIHDQSVTKGFGRFMTFPEVSVIFFSPPPSDSPIPNGNIIVKAAVVVGLYNPTPGIPCWSPNLRYSITGLKNFTINGQSLNLPDVGPGNTTPPCNVLTGRVGLLGGGNHNTSVMGLPVQFTHFVSFGGDAYKTVGNDGTDNTFPFATPLKAAGFKNGGAVVVSTDPAAPKTMRFSGGTIQIQIFAGYESVPTGQAPTQLIQTLNVQFPPIPQCPIPDPVINPSGQKADDFDTRMKNGTFIEGTPNSTNTDLTLGDVIRSVQVPSNGRGATASNAAMGDLRILAAIPVVPTTMFKPHPDYLSPTKHAAHNLRTGAPGYYPGGTPTDVNGNATKTALVPGQKGWSPEPIAAPGQAGAMGLTGPGDFDNGYGVIEDGPYINKPDEGDSVNGGQVYFARGSQLVESGATYAPNRQASSAVMFGSLPTGVKATEAALYAAQSGIAQGVAARPWQTLLFCPYPAAGLNHPGFGTSAPGAPALHTPPYTIPPDHLWLDLFTMPVVEPFAISEPFSTAGKVNLNYQIAPFRHITRSTGIRAVMKSTQMLAIPTADATRSGGVRYQIEMEPEKQGTLVGFENIFNRGDIFRSASQICDIFLVPKGAGATYANMTGWWTKYLHTGDNSREFPYGHIYPRVTTKSNVFTVHVWVQALQKAGGAQQDPASWDETKDRVLSEYRGSNIVERYIDASDPNLPDFAASSPAPPPIDNYYKFRIVSSKRFVP